MTENFTVITVGRLVPWKGNEIVIKSIQTFNDVCLQIVGSGNEMENLKAIAGKETTFLGNKSHKETLHLMSHADLLILNSSYEGMSHVLIEAIITTPIAFSYCAGNIEFYEFFNQTLKNLNLVQKFELNNINEIAQCIKNVKDKFGKKDFSVFPCRYC